MCTKRVGPIVLVLNHLVRMKGNLNVPSRMFFFPVLQSSSFLASAGLHLDSMSALHLLQFATKQGKISHPDGGVVKDRSCMGSKGTRSFEAW